MASKKLSSWFMRNIILPNNEIIDIPGYIAIQQFSKETGKFYLREVFLPEDLLAEVESAFIRKYRKKGEEALYRAGKEWGYWFCTGSGLPTKGALPKKDFLGFMDSFMKLLEAEYTTKTTATVDYDADLLTFKAQNLMICSKNGRGQFLLGTLTGAWAYVTGRDDIEGSQPKCQGRKDGSCTLYCGPAAGIKGALKAKIDKEAGLDPGYIQLNGVKKLPYAKNSLKSLLEAGFVKYAGGFFHINRNRLVLNEASSVYFLEKALGRLQGGGELLFDITWKHYMVYSDKSGNPAQRIGDILPALGWGDFSFRDEGVYVYAYPYSRHYTGTTFPIIRGMLSGLMSANGRQVKLRKAVPVVADDELQLDIRP